MLSRLKKDDTRESNPFDGVKKNLVMHEARCFDAAQIDPRECAAVLTKIMYLLVRGETFTDDEATKLFFGVTKLFRAEDPSLRRLVYLLIKELGKDQENVFIVISSLSKDMTSSNELYQANALRVLAKVIDSTLLGQLERFIKQALVDKSPLVASSALVASQTLFYVSPDVVKRWVNETHEALSSRSKMVQFHALSLLHLIKRHDRLAISKVVSSLAKKPPKSPLAHCQLIRYAIGVLSESSNSNTARQLLDFLMGSLHHREPMVAYESARALCFLPNASQQILAPAISILQDLLNAASPVQRFAAVKTLSRVAQLYPMHVIPCSVDLELLINDSNRNIATLAITTLLQTGVEANIDRLMNSISVFMSEISDELREILVDAILTLCLKFPHRHLTFLDFLSNILREEGGLSYKKAIINAVVQIMNEIPESKVVSLEHLCDFIEDCEFPLLAVQVLNLLGEEGPKTQNPEKYIRYIFNRVVLEQPRIRSAAVVALAKFAEGCPDLKDSIQKLFEHSLVDNDDEVRDRTVYYHEIFERHLEEQSTLFNPDFGVDSNVLEYSLMRFIESGSVDRFTEEDIIEVERGAADEPTVEEKKEDLIVVQSLKPDTEALESIPEFRKLGSVIKSCAEVKLTEPESEYFVSCVKHIFADHVVLQFNVTNTLEDVLLKEISVEADILIENWSEEMIVPIDILNPNEKAVSFTCLSRVDSFRSEPIDLVLRFNYLDYPPAYEDDEGDEDEYQLDSLEIVEIDFVSPGDDCDLAEFRGLWEGTGPENENTAMAVMNVDSLQDAVKNALDKLSMQAIDGSAIVPEDVKSHTINLRGVFIDGTEVFARAGFRLDPQSGVVQGKMAARSTDPWLSEVIAIAFQ